MRVPRKDPALNDILDILDQKFEVAQGDFLTAWESLDSEELNFVDHELEQCITNRRYYLENYHVIKDEHGNVQTLYPFWDHQEVIYEVLSVEWAANGTCRLIILKPRQCGGTVWSAGITFHATIFTPQAFTLMMAHEEDASAEIYRRVWDAYNYLPWWMRPEKASKQQERHIVFQRLDERRRMIDPGLGSTLMISNAQKSAGVAIGRTIRCAHFSEVSRYPSANVYTADIKPSMNARDMLAIMESTAYGRRGLFYNMWHAAEQGKSNWVPVFIPVYKVRKYFLPIKPKEKFSLTDDERALRGRVRDEENYTIPFGFFKWRRTDIKETENAEGSDETHYEAYPVTPGEAFISSGFGAFPRKCLNEQQRENCRDPLKIGDIDLVDQTNLYLPPELHLHAPNPSELMEKPEWHDRLWIWEEPDQNEIIEYYIGADVAAGDGQDYSDCAVYRLGFDGEPNVQVAEWHGLINPSHFARVIAALGMWYHQAEIAVEYQMSGITTGNELQWTLDYPNIYRWKHMDKIGNTMTMHTHWLTNFRTRDDAINRMAESLLDRTVVIRNRHLIEEMRDFGRLEGETKAEGLDNNDDMVMANIICLAAARQSGKGVQGLSTANPEHNAILPKTPKVFGLFNSLRQQIGQFETEAAAKDFVTQMETKYKRSLGLRIQPLMVMKANTCWSPIYDAKGAENQLYEHFGIPDRYIMPDIVQSYRKLLTAMHYEREEEE